MLALACRGQAVTAVPGDEALVFGDVERREVRAARIVLPVVVAVVVVGAGCAGERTAAVDVGDAAPVPGALDSRASVAGGTSSDVVGAELMAAAVTTVVSTVTVTAGPSEPEQPTRTITAGRQTIAGSDRRSALADRQPGPSVNA